MESENQNESGNKSKKMLLIVGIILIIIVALIAMVMVMNKTPKAIFEEQIDKLLSYENAEDHKSMKMNMELSMNVEGGQETEEMANLLNDAKMSFNVEVDNETKDEQYRIELTKGDNEIINASAKMDSESEKAYINLGELFNKTIEMDISEMFEDGANATESLNFMQLLTAKKAEAILKKEIKAQLKNEYFTSEKSTIDSENVTKNMLKMSGKELKDTIKTICQNLSQNDEFINCFENGDEVKSMLQDIIYEVDDDKISDDTYLELDLYTKGIFPKIVRVDFVITENNQEIRIQVTQVSNEEYAYQILQNNEQAIEGTVKIQDNDNQAKVEVTATAEGTTVTATATGNVVYDEELSQFDMNDVVATEELTMEDIMILYGNFLQSNLYDIIEQFSGDTSLMSGNSYMFE